MSTPFFLTFEDEEIHDVFPKVFSVFWVVLEGVVCTLDVDDVEGGGVDGALSRFLRHQVKVVAFGQRHHVVDNCTRQRVLDAV